MCTVYRHVIFQRVLTLRLLLEMPMIYFLLKFELLLCVLLFSLPCSMSVEVTIAAPIFMMDQQNWQINIEIPSAAAIPTDGLRPSLPLIFFFKNVVQNINPCPLITDICCLAQYMPLKVWGGDTSILDPLAAHCNTRNTDAWSKLIELKDKGVRTDFILNLTRADLEEDKMRSLYITDADVYDVTILVLLLRKWNGMINVDSIFQTVRIDFERKQHSPVNVGVDSIDDCSNLNPDNSFYVPRQFSVNQTSLRCEWVCKANYVRCPLYASDDEASCVAKPAFESRFYFARVGVLSWFGGFFQTPIDIFDKKKQLQEMSDQLFDSLQLQGFIERRCLLYLTTQNLLKDAKIDRSTDIAADSLTALDMTEAFEIMGDMSPVRTSLTTPIAYSVPANDRLETGFIEYNILYVMETESGLLAEQGELSKQSEKLRLALNNFFMYGSGNATVIYVSNVEVLDRGVQDTEYISVWNFTLLVFWAAVIVSLVLWNFFSPSGISPCADTSCEPCVLSKGSCINSKHSPHGLRIILSSSGFLFLVLFGFIITYIWVLLPRFDVPSDKRAFLTLALFATTLLPAIAVYVCFCTCLTMCLNRKQ